eukprot:TRINITY_DN6448_c0_g1_i8.p1 TRINITY_DN6448_c0_g1~~TRINITY_DN6448_c0_g1_i8.p1  ORF type:complete len:411 (-),score=74.58 TRINITY_DN6448_c0_g1_i8:152-1384(-)
MMITAEMLEAVVSTQSTGIGGDTTSFERATQHVISVSTSTVKLNGKATMKVIDKERVNIFLGLENADTPQPDLRGYAEVYGLDSTGNSKPACWIGGLISLEDSQASLELNLKWLQLAGVSGPLNLSNVYLADMVTSFPITKIDGPIVVENSELLSPPVVWPQSQKMEITNDMLYGKNPLHPINQSDIPETPNLVLLPGYCTDVNPFARNPGDFSNGFFPVDKGNYGNHEYTTKILAQVESNKLNSFGVIGHSQGGLVALHMHNFFWSGLESATGGLLIQTLGTPYLGSSAAGSAANLGEIFGIGCGSNSDLSRDGAANWLSGISAASRADVSYYTTTYKQGNLLGDWCSLPMNLILEWPNDGVTELEFSSLPGGVNKGNKEKWCHSTDMGYPAQYDDHSRNVEMNSAAAR